MKFIKRPYLFLTVILSMFLISFITTNLSYANTYLVELESKNEFNNLDKHNLNYTIINNNLVKINNNKNIIKKYIKYNFIEEDKKIKNNNLNLELKKDINKANDVAIDADEGFNDPGYLEQWYLQDNISASVKISSAWYKNFKQCSTVAVLDTGVDYNNKELKNNIVKNKKEKFNGVDDDNNGYIDDIYGADVIDRKGSAKDDNGHGTHIAGTIVATSNNNYGIVGLCQNSNVLPVKFLDKNGEGYLGDLVQALYHSISKGVKVINCSFITDEYSKSLYKALEYAKTKNVIIVTASGNENTNIDKHKKYPASYNLENILTVGSVNRENKKSPFSNYGKKTVDIYAPGSKIISTYLNNKFAYMSGTSMSAPIISSSMALLTYNFDLPFNKRIELIKSYSTKLKDTSKTKIDLENLFINFG